MFHFLNVALNVYQLNNNNLCRSTKDKGTIVYTQYKQSILIN